MDMIIVENTVVEYNVQNQIVLQKPELVPIFVVAMVVVNDVLTVLIGSIVEWVI